MKSANCPLRAVDCNSAGLINMFVLRFFNKTKVV
jgi:hypothetical protein